MVSEYVRVAFVDQAGAVFQETSLVAVPGLGDSVELPDKKVGGVVDLITWLVPKGILSTPSVIVRLRPYA